MNKDDMHRLISRIQQLYRLRELEAPDMIVQKQEGMVMQSLGVFLGDKDPDNFSLPSYADVSERLDALQQKHQHGLLLKACQVALPYLGHLRDAYEEGAPELEDWSIVAGAIASVTGEHPDPEDDPDVTDAEGDSV